MFATVLHNFQSPENVGIVVRTHVAFGGGPLVLIGPDPWRFKKSTQAFSWRLERVADIRHIPDDASFFRWCVAEAFVPVAVEIANDSIPLPGFEFPSRPALILGNEKTGLSNAFLANCSAVVTIPQFGEVGSLNAAVACCIAIYEMNRLRVTQRPIIGGKYLASEGQETSVRPRSALQNDQNSKH